MPIREYFNVGARGIAKDGPAHELPEEFWTDGLNVRFEDSKASQIYGHAVFDTSICASPTFVMAVPRQDGPTDFWVYCSETDVYAFDTSANYKLTTSSITATGQNTWTGCLLSGIAVLNYQKNAPLYWSVPPDGSTALNTLPDWSASWTCKVIRSYKNYLVALNTTEGASTYPYRVRWSDAADAGTIPSSWDATDTTKDAGFNDILEGGDLIVDAAPLHDRLMIYKERSIWAMQYIGGTLVFNFQKVYSDFGCIGLNAIVPFGRSHFVVGQTEIYVHDGYSDPVPLLQGRMKTYFFNTVTKNNRDKIFCVSNSAYKEIWTCFPATSTGVVDKALIWNWENNTWSIRSLPDAYAAATGGINVSSSPLQWDSGTGTWDSQTTLWSSGTGYTDEGRLVFASPSNLNMYYMDEGWTFAGANYTSSLERQRLPITAQKPVQERMKMIKRIWVRGSSATGVGTLNIYIGTQERVEDTVTWHGPYRYDPDTTKKLDCRVTGRFISIKFETTAAMGWQLDSFGLEYDEAGLW